MNYTEETLVQQTTAANRDYLWSDDTGLPVDVYTEDDVDIKAEDVFRRIYRAYPTLPSPYYAPATV